MNFSFLILFLILFLTVINSLDCPVSKSIQTSPAEPQVYDDLSLSPFITNSLLDSVSQLDLSEHALLIQDLLL